MTVTTIHDVELWALLARSGPESLRPHFAAAVRVECDADRRAVEAAGDYDTITSCSSTDGEVMINDVCEPCASPEEAAL